MYSFPKSLQRLIKELSKLPSIGEKSATRLAYHIINNDPALAESLSSALLEMKANVKFCTQCFALTDNQFCSICTQPQRDAELLCVVEKPMDVIAFERISEFKGLYHVLHGVWAPLRGKGPESMKLVELEARLQTGQVKEVIIATSSTVEGDATALYIASMIANKGITSTRLAQGVPKGGELEYLDDVTLSRAFNGRCHIGV